jgi:shikimate dehydrogenase
MPRIVAIIGYPLAHSLSPLFQQSAFDFYHLDVSYEAWEIKPPELAETIARLRQPGVLGANVTIPYKEKVLPWLDKLDDLASRIGAVNTILNDGSQLVGYNTDAEGFLKALRQEGRFEPQGKQAIILGAGGAARAVSFALVSEGIRTLIIFNRTLERAENLAAQLRKEAGSTEIKALPWQEPELSHFLSQSELLVNCTPIGMKHSPGEGLSPLEWLPQDILVYDLVYQPQETPLLKKAKEAGAATLSGLSMLVYQGAASFQLWTGKEAPLEAMFQAAQEGLRRPAL